MAGDIDLGDDEGYVTIKFGGHEKRLDLYMAYNKIMDFDDAVPTDEEGRRPRGVWLDMVAQWLGQLGFPEPSHRLAEKFVAAIFSRVQELKNDVGGFGKPSSPDSTEPTSSDSPTPTN